MRNRIPREFVDSLMQHTDIVSVISEFVPLRRAGAEYVGLCPFHNDNNPSFSVSQKKGVYLCRSCGAGGTALTFLMKQQGLGFPDAVRTLALAAGMAVPASGQDSNENSDALTPIFDALTRAAALYRGQLLKTPEVLQYLTRRGVSSEIADRFALGFAPHSGRLITETMKDVPPAVLERAGLVHPAEKGKPQRDWMYDRIIFPIRNAQGRVVGFGGRAMQEHSPVKYLNTPETPVFKKRRELYGFYEGAASIRKSNQAVVVEGYMDVVVTHGHGQDNTVSCMGTALSEIAVAKLFRTADEVVYCMDPDPAGRRAAVRAMETSLPYIDATKSAFFLSLPEQLDPDEYIVKYGAESMRQRVAQAIPLSKFMFAELLEGLSLESVEGRAKYAARAMGMIGKISSPVLKSFMTEELRTAVGYPSRLPGETEQTTQYQASSSTPGVLSLGLRVLSLILLDPKTAQYFDPECMQAAAVTAHEVETIQAVVDAVRRMNPENVTKERILEKFAGSAFEKLLVRACDTEEARGGHTDPVAQLVSIVKFLSGRVARTRTIKQPRISPTSQSPA